MTYAINKGVIYQESEICDASNDTTQIYAERSDRVLVRDMQAAKRTSDGVCGFYDMVTGEFMTNAGYGDFSCVADDSSNNILEVPVELNVTFRGSEIINGNNVDRTDVCSNAELINSTKIKCTMPANVFSENDGTGKVDLTVYANGVEATPGTEDADDRNSSTTNDNWLKCQSHNSKYTTLSDTGTLNDETWGWRLNETAPTISSAWNKVPNIDTFVASKMLPSGVNNDGANSDRHKVWFSVKTSSAQPACVYKSQIIFTTIANV